MAAAALLLFRSRSVVSCSSLIVSSSSSASHLFCNSPASSYHNRYCVQLFHFSTQIQHPSTTTLVFNEDYFVSKYKFSPQIASKIVSASARMRNPQNADLVLSFFKQTGFSHAHLERILRHHPNLLSSCPEKSVKPKLKIFQDLGFSTAEATQLIARDFTILKYQPKRIIDSLDVYRRLLGSNDNVIELIKKCRNLLYVDPEKTILPNIQFLETCGIQTSQINSFIYSYTSFFLQSPENMKRCVHKVDEMGVDRTSKMFIYAARAVSDISDESLKLKLKSLQDLGFSQDDIFRLFRTAPVVIGLSIRKIKEVKEVLLETGKYDMSSIIKYPMSLTYNVEKRYKPRLQVLKELESKGLISKWPALSTLSCTTDKSFIERFVAPNINEVGEDFIAKATASSKPERETGLKPKA